MSDSDAIKVLIKGLPHVVTIPMLLQEFRVIFRRIYIRKFWIHDLSVMGGNLKQMTILLKYRAEAHRAQNYLNSKPFVLDTKKYPLVVEILEDANIVDGCADDARAPERTRSRSRSPVYRQETFKYNKYKPRASREHYRNDDCDPHHKRQQPAPNKPHQKYPPMKNDFRSSNSSSARYPPEWSINSRYSAAQPSNSKYPPECSRYSLHSSSNSKYSLKYTPECSKNSRYCPEPSKHSRYSPESSKHSRYPPEPSKNSRYSPEPSKNSRYSPEPSKNSRYSPEPSKNSRYYPEPSKNSTYSPEPSKNSRYSPEPSKNSRYYPEPSKNSRYSPEPPKNSRYSPEPSKYSRYSPAQTSNPKYHPDW